MDTHRDPVTGSGKAQRVPVALRLAGWVPLGIAGLAMVVYGPWPGLGWVAIVASGVGTGWTVALACSERVRLFVGIGLLILATAAIAQLRPVTAGFSTYVAVACLFLVGGLGAVIVAVISHALPELPRFFALVATGMLACWALLASPTIAWRVELRRDAFDGSARAALAAGPGRYFGEAGTRAPGAAAGVIDAESSVAGLPIVGGSVPGDGTVHYCLAGDLWVCKHELIYRPPDATVRVEDPACAAVTERVAGDWYERTGPCLLTGPDRGAIR